MLSYLGVTGAELGFLMNFGASSLQTDRLPNFLHDRKPLPWQSTTPSDILFPELTNHILQCLHTVQFTLGPGFLHQLYRRATRLELTHQAVNFVYLKQLPLRFETLHMTSVPARLFLIEKKLLLATIAVQSITSRHTEKLRWAMQTTNTPLCLIANFYANPVEVRFLRGSQG